MELLILRYIDWYFCKKSCKVIWILFLKFSWNNRLLRRHFSVKSFYFFQCVVISYGIKRKNSVMFFSLFILILRWFLNVLRAFVTWSSVVMKSVSQPWPVDIFKFGAILNKIIRNFCYGLTVWNYFFWNYFLLNFTGGNWFSFFD